MIGREDGSLEVWDVDGQGVPQLVVSTQLSESITSVGGGYITNAASPDIIVHTFTGKVRLSARDFSASTSAFLLSCLLACLLACLPAFLLAWIYSMAPAVSSTELRGWLCRWVRSSAGHGHCSPWSIWIHVLLK